MRNKKRKTISAIAAFVMAASGTVSALPAASASAAETTEKRYVYNGYTVTYRVADAWGNTERVIVTLSNTGTETLENWMLYFDPNGTAYGFNGVQQDYTDTEIAYFRNAGYNDSIAPGESTSFEYLVDSCEAEPERFALCQTRAEKTGGIEVNLSTYSAWGSSFNGVINIHNLTNKPISAWELTFDTNYTITWIPNSWAADVISLGTGCYLMKGTYNDVIEPNGTVSLGFIGEMNGDPVLDSYSLTEVTVDEAYLNNLTAGETYTVSDLEEMNADSVYPLDIEENDDGTISVIDGKYTNVLVTDEESARNSLKGVQDLLGIHSLANDLELDYIYENNSAEYKSYYFRQVYHGIPVFRKSLTVVARNNGEALSVDSSYCPLADFSTEQIYSAETVAAEYNVPSVTSCVYASGEYEDAPVMAYIAESFGTGYVVSALDKSVLFEYPTVSLFNSPYDISGTSVDDGEEINGEDADFLNPDGTYFHRAATFSDALIHNQEEAKALLLSEPLAVDFSGENSLNKLSEAHIQTSHYHTAYHFDQMYNDKLVFGREGLVAARNEDFGLYTFESNVVPIPDGFSTEPSAAMEENLSFRESVSTIDHEQLVIYTWDQDENDAEPQLAYICTSFDEKKTYIITENGEWIKDLGKGLDEGAYENYGTAYEPDYRPRPMKLRYFPITKENNAEGLSYKLSTTKRAVGIDVPAALSGEKIEMRMAGGEAEDPDAAYDVTKHTVKTDPNSADITYFYVPEGVSAYLNLIAVSQWYAHEPGIERDNYNRSSDSDAEHLLNRYYGDMLCGINSSIMKERYNLDNAYSDKFFMSTCVKVNYAYTYGAAKTVIAHEYTHGIFKAFCNYDVSLNIAGEINEGYADTMGAQVAENWDHAYETEGLAARMNEYRNARYKIKTKYNLNNPFITLYDSHSLIPYMVRPAYLLKTKYGYTTNELSRLYYNSMSVGKYTDGAVSMKNAYIPNNKGRASTLYSFRSHIMRAARAMNYTVDQMSELIAVFDEAWGRPDEEYVRYVTVVDSETLEPFCEWDPDIRYYYTDEEGEHEIKVPNWNPKLVPGFYDMVVKMDGYIPLRQQIYKHNYDENITVMLVKEGAEPGQISVCAHDFVDRLPRDCTVTLKQVSLNGETAVGSYQTGAAVGQDTGCTGPITVPAGYYKIYVEGAYDFFVKNVYVSAGEHKTELVHYYDVNVNQDEHTVFFHFDYVEMKDHMDVGGEGDLSFNLDDFSLSLPELDHRTAADGQQIAYPTIENGILSRGVFLYCYARPEERFEMLIHLKDSDIAKLQEIAAMENTMTVGKMSDSDQGGLYTLEIRVRNNQLKNNNFVFHLSAEQLLNAANGGNVVRLGAIEWSAAEKTYVFTPLLS